VSADASSVTSLLAEKYPGLGERRGLWLWAGGWDRAVDYGPPDAAWTAMWRAVLDEEGGTPDPLELVREALIDHPGEAAWLAYVTSQRKGPESTVMLETPVVVELVERLGPELGAPETAETALRSLLAAFNRGSFADLYAALAPTLQGRWSGGFRRDLERGLARLVEDEDDAPDRDACARRLAEHVALLPTFAPEDPVWAEHGATLAEAFLRADASAAALAAEAPLAALQAHVEAGTDLALITRVRLLAAQRRLAVDAGPAGALRIARAFQAAIWGTTGSGTDT